MTGTPNEMNDIQNQSLFKDSLSPRTIESIVERLGWFCLFCAVTLTLVAVMEGLLQADILGFANSGVATLSWIAIVFISLVMTAICNRGFLSARATLKLGLVYEVFVAFGISISESAVALAHDLPVLGMSRLAFWIALTAALIPNKPVTKLVVAFLSASTWPLAYIVNMNVLKLQPVSINRYYIYVYVPYVMVILAYFISKRIYTLTTDADNARELGSYHLICRIGEGGMGEVWRAQHSMLARDAAIKLIRTDEPNQPAHRVETRRQRFKREAQVIASLESPHTVRLFDFGLSQTGSFYYVMELLDGINLQTLVEDFGPLPASRLIYIVRQVCDSLQEAHSHGVVHRDVKPSNIFICKVGLEYDFVKVLDFGLAKDVNDSIQLTMEGASLGTPDYMAPETVMAEGKIDHRVDIYGIGCTAYFALAALEVFSERTPGATAAAHVIKRPVPPSQRTNIQIPSELEEIILRCLKKEPENRIQTAEELRGLLGAIAIDEWTQLDAASWWESYLPACSSYRTPKQYSFAETIEIEEGAENGRIGRVKD